MYRKYFLIAKRAIYVGLYIKFSIFGYTNRIFYKFVTTKWFENLRDFDKYYSPSNLNPFRKKNRSYVFKIIIIYWPSTHH